MPTYECTQSWGVTLLFWRRSWLLISERFFCGSILKEQKCIILLCILFEAFRIARNAKSGFLTLKTLYVKQSFKVCLTRARKCRKFLLHIRNTGKKYVYIHMRLILPGVRMWEGPLLFMEDCRWGGLWGRLAQGEMEGRGGEGMGAWIEMAV